MRQRSGPLVFSGFAALVVCAVSLQGCRPGEGRGQALSTSWRTFSVDASQTTVRYAYWALNRQETELLHRLKAQFEAQHPNIEVELLGVPQRYYEKLQTMLVAGEEPDAFSINYGRLADFVRAGTVMDLRPFVSEDPTLPAAYYPRAWQAVEELAESVRHPGIWGLPKDWPPAGLVIYNRDLLAAAGVLPPTVHNPWAWQDFQQACQAIAAANLPDVYPTALNLYPYSVFTWVYQAGGNLVSEIGTITADTPQVAEAIDYVLELWRSGLAPRPTPGRDNSFELFAAGRVALLIGTFYTVQACRRLTDVEWGVGPPLRHRRYTCACLPTYVAISRRSRNSTAAWLWARYLTVDGGSCYAAAALTVPASRRALSPMLFLARPPLDRARAAVMQAMAISKPPPLHPLLSYDLVTDEVRTALEEAIAKRLDGKAVATALARRLRRAKRAIAHQLRPTLQRSRSVVRQQPR